MSENWNRKLARLEELITNGTYPTLEDLCGEFGDTPRNTRRLIKSLEESGKIERDPLRGGYYWAKIPMLPPLVEGGYAGAFENHLIISHALRFDLEITLVTKGDHREYRIVPILLTRLEGRVVLRAAVIPDIKLKDFPIDSWTFCTAAKFCGDWNAVCQLANGSPRRL